VKLQYFESYAWWFIVTVSTVGYGDISPGTEGGRIVAIIIIWFGVGTGALIIGKTAEWIITMMKKE